MARILVVDPGERTGWVSCEVTDEGVIIDGSIEQGVDTIKDFSLSLHARQTGRFPFDVIIYERWVLYGSHAMEMIGSEFQPVQLIGMIRLCGWLGGSKLVSLPASCKEKGRAAMPEIFKSMLSHCSEEHSKDALDLASYYLWKWYIK